MGWAVLSPTAGPAPGALAGEYVGASADVGMGLGAGVNVLVGGSGRSFALQPVSVEGSVALNVTLGLPDFSYAPLIEPAKEQGFSCAVGSQSQNDLPERTVLVEMAERLGGLLERIGPRDEGRDRTAGDERRNVFPGAPLHGGRQRGPFSAADADAVRRVQHTKRSFANEGLF